MQLVLSRLALITGAFVFCVAAAEDHATRAQRLKHLLMAPCCWSESLAAHSSPLASEMRAEIDQLVAKGKTDAEIMDLFKARYGKRIMVVPDGAAGVWLNVIPVALTLAGAAWVAWLVRRWSRPAPGPDQPGTVKAA